jgi:hypothetical protein
VIGWLPCDYVDSLPWGPCGARVASVRAPGGAVGASAYFLVTALVTAPSWAMTSALGGDFSPVVWAGTVALN